MKKSKIIVPALGLLLLSTAASVSGTVAWFTASTSATVETSSFTINNASGSLDVALSPRVGTQITSDQVALAASSTLTDGSYDHVNDNLWAHNPNTPENDTTHCISKGSEADAYGNATPGLPWKAGVLNSVSYYHAISWTITLTYTYGTDNSTVVDLYFDNATSLVTAGSVPSGYESKTYDTYKGFRIAFICGSQKLVWADQQVTAKCTYITTGSPSQATDYTSKKLIASDTTSNTGAAATTIVASNDTEAHGDELNFLGSFATGSASANLSITCVAWYEGTDENVVANSKMQPVSATMGFFTRTHSARS